MRQPKPRAIPASWPTFVLKCAWDATAVRIKVRARDGNEAIDRAWKQMRKTEGGDKCLNITIVGVNS